MKDPLLVLAAIAALAIAYVLFPVFLDAFLRFRRERVVRCPHKQQQTALRLDAERAGLTALIGPPRLQVKRCPLWDGDVFCKQECLSQV